MGPNPEVFAIKPSAQTEAIQRVQKTVSMLEKLNDPSAPIMTTVDNLRIFNSPIEENLESVGKKQKFIVVSTDPSHPGYYLAESTSSQEKPLSNILQQVKEGRKIVASIQNSKDVGPFRKQSELVLYVRVEPNEEGSAKEDVYILVNPLPNSPEGDNKFMEAVRNSRRESQAKYLNAIETSDRVAGLLIKEFPDAFSPPPPASPPTESSVSTPTLT